MEAYEQQNIQEIALSSPFFRAKVERFLGANGLRLEALDAYYTLQSQDGTILAGAGIYHDIVKCVAVDAAARSEGLMVPLLSHVVAQAAARGIMQLKVFTKPEYQSVFQSLGFHLLAQAPKAILMENGRGLERYCAYLRSCHSERSEESSGVIIMNANPFTLGHQYLISKALEQVDTLYIIPVREEASRFPYAERLAMIKAGIADMALVATAEENCFLARYPKSQFSPAAATTSIVTVPDGSDYQISAATFPTYFLKDLSDAAETQMLLDIDLYARWISPALGNPVRFVGSEPTDALTARYNALLQESVHCVEIPRRTYVATAEENWFSARYPKSQFSPAAATTSISASAVRAALDRGCFHEAAALCPKSSWPYLLADLAQRALQMELDTPMKPGLVGPDSNGAHKDMDYALMQKGIAAIRPFFAPMAQAESPEALRQLGIQAEEAMLAATGGVNTHRGAIFCLGLALNAAGRRMDVADNQRFMQNAVHEIAEGVLRKSLTDNQLHSTLVGARRMALSGYQQLFEDWLPFYRKQKADAVLSGASTLLLAPESTASAAANQKLLLRIMSTLDDTCILKRAGAERAGQVKQEAKETKDLHDLCTRYAAEGISPGGAADMLALTIFIDSILL